MNGGKLATRWIWLTRFGMVEHCTKQQHREKWDNLFESIKLDGWRVLMYREFWQPKESGFLFDIVMSTHVEDVPIIEEPAANGTSTAKFAPIELFCNGFSIGVFTSLDGAHRAMHEKRQEVIDSIYRFSLPTAEETDELIKKLRKMK